MDIETNRKRLLKQQTGLRRLLTDQAHFKDAMQLFYHQHASLHTAQVGTQAQLGSSAGIWSFEDAVLDVLAEIQFRRIPKNREHSIVWCIWHIARIEDTAINILIADSPQVFNQANWRERLGVPFRDCGNEMGAAELLKLSNEINLQVLREYRAAVGLRTQEITAQLTPADLKMKVKPIRIQRVLDEGAILESARGITDYWSKRDIAGLLLMPASRHMLVHLGEAYQLRNRKS